MKQYRIQTLVGSMVSIKADRLVADDASFIRLFRGDSLVFVCPHHSLVYAEEVQDIPETVRGSSSSSSL